MPCTQSDILTRGSSVIVLARVRIRPSARPHTPSRDKRVRTIVHLTQVRIRTSARPHASSRDERIRTIVHLDQFVTAEEEIAAITMPIELEGKFVEWCQHGLSADPPKQDGNEAKGSQSLPRRQQEDFWSTLSTGSWRHQESRRPFFQDNGCQRILNSLSSREDAGGARWKWIHQSVWRTLCTSIWGGQPLWLCWQGRPRTWSYYTTFLAERAFIRSLPIEFQEFATLHHMFHVFLDL